MDFTLQKLEKQFRILQITDMQVIDASQRRTPDRLRIDEQKAWPPSQFDALCGNQIRSLVAQTRPHLIITTGDNVYGSFDDNGTVLEWFCRLMDSFGIPWAPVFGNHDNESKKGIDWQCEQLEKSKFCLFKRGNVTGNSNYSVGIAEGDRLIRILHMADSNGCLLKKGLYPDQLALIRERSRRHPGVPGLMAFHIPVQEFLDAEQTKGYGEQYTIGADVPAKDGDFGFKLEEVRPIRTESFIPFLKECSIDGVFVGHCHSVCTHITYEGIRWVYGLKTGQYDYHVLGNLGGTLITLEDDSFAVRHVPALASYAPFPGRALMFRNTFAGEEE